jgi:hypothetical protein
MSNVRAWFFIAISRFNDSRSHVLAMERFPASMKLALQLHLSPLEVCSRSKIAAGYVCHIQQLLTQPIYIYSSFESIEVANFISRNEVKIAAPKMEVPIFGAEHSVMNFWQVLIFGVN